MIRHVLETLLADEEDLENILYNTLASLIDTPQTWDKYDHASNLLSPRKFIKFILSPYVAAALISEDFETDFEDAVEILEVSNHYGCLVNNNAPADENVDILVTPTKNPDANEPPRHRKVALVVRH